MKFLEINMTNKIVMKLLNNSLKSHKYVKLLNYTKMYCTLQKSEKCVEAYKEIKDQKDNLTSYVGKTSKSIQHHKNTHINEIFLYMNEFNQLTDEQKDYEQIKKSDKFLQLCTMIQQNARSLSIHNIFEVLQFLWSLKVPSDTVLLETLLQLLRVNINNLTTLQITHLYYKLKNQNETHLIKGLLFALPIVFKNRIQIELDSTDQNIVIKALKFAITIRNINSVTYLINLLCKNNESKNINHAETILYGLCLIPQLNKFHLRLLYQINDVITKNYEQLEVKSIKLILTGIERRLTNNIIEPPFFENIVHTLCHVVRNKYISFSDDIQILTLLNKMQYKSIPFMDYLAEKCVENPKLLTEAQSYEIIHFIQGMNMSSYKTKYWETLEPLITNYILSDKCDFNAAVTITFRLLSLNCYNEKLLKHVFSLKHDLLIKISIFDIMTLHQCVKVLYPNYQGVTLSQNVINNFLEHTKRDKNSFLKNYLEEIVGGDIYVRNNMKTKLGHHIDHIIVLKPDGSPMAIDNYDNNTCVEDIVAPPEYCRIVILLVPESFNCRNSEREQTTWELIVKSIKILTGYTVVSINIHRWNTLSHNERKLYLLKSLPNLKLCKNVIT